MGNGDAPKREHLLCQTKDGKVLQKCSTTYNFVKSEDWARQLIFWNRAVQMLTPTLFKMFTLDNMCLYATSNKT
jgi:hypothetical protein